MKRLYMAIVDWITSAGFASPETPFGQDFLFVPFVWPKILCAGSGECNQLETISEHTNSVFDLESSANSVIIYFAGNPSSTSAVSLSMNVA